ncbi:MAG: hypothetical protein ACR2I8_06805 [Steroidobacteraceae bacterium]
MWLPRPLYEAKPLLSVGTGAVCLGLAWFIDQAPRSLLFVLGGGLVTLGLLLWMKRRDYRNTQSTYDRRAIDD